MFKFLFFFFLIPLNLRAEASQFNCQARYDQIGVTHQKVKNLDEYYYCFGFHHAQDRAWQMDYFRRLAKGRNAELYGYDSLKSDLMMRLLDLPHLAKRLLSELPRQERSWLEFYANGVNEGFKDGKKAKEFLDLKINPEVWTAEDSILVLLLQSFDQTRKTFFRDYEEEKSKELWKDKAAELFEEEGVPWFNTILKEGEYPKGHVKNKTTSNSKPLPHLWANFPEVFGKESGSNNWVIHKSKSKEGFAMLANDPHLDLKTPLFWYWLHLESPEANVLGASLPGVPLIVSGTNGRVAWGLTNAYINTADAVFIKDFPKDHLVSFRPKVDVKIGFFHLPFFFKKFEKTKEGYPVLPLELEKNEKIILRWTGFQLKGPQLSSMFQLKKAQTVEEMDQYLQKVGVPAWNFVFADKKGDIGYRVVGEIFREDHKDEFGISYESLVEFKGKKLLHPLERPHVLKPKRGYVYTANNRHWPSDSRYFGGRGYTQSFRGYRIDELLDREEHDVGTFKNIQCDRQAVDARFFIPLLLNHVVSPELKGWNFSTHDQSVAPSLYRRWMDLLLEGWQVNENGLYRLLKNLDEAKKKEMASFYNVAKEQVQNKTWGNFHRLSFDHLSRNKNWKFSPEIPGIGDNHSVDPGSSKWNPEKQIYEQFSGASMRMIVVLKETPEVHLALPGYNRKYTESQTSIPAWEEWRNCQYSKINW